MTKVCNIDANNCHVYDKATSQHSSLLSQITKKVMLFNSCHIRLGLKLSQTKLLRKTFLTHPEDLRVLLWNIIETHVRGHVMQLNLTTGPFGLCRPICCYSGLLKYTYY